MHNVNVKKLHVVARAEADLHDDALEFGTDSRTPAFHALGAASGVDESWDDVLVVEAHVANILFVARGGWFITLRP